MLPDGTKPLPEPLLTYHVDIPRNIHMVVRALLCFIAIWHWTFLSVLFDILSVSVIIIFVLLRQLCEWCAYFVGHTLNNLTSCDEPGACLRIKGGHSRYVIPIIKIRRSHDRLRFMMVIPLLVKQYLSIRKGPQIPPYQHCRHVQRRPLVEDSPRSPKERYIPPPELSI